MTPRRIAVTLHDVEPATLTRCALIRDWLCDHGVERVTLLVVPAPEAQWSDDHRPELATWLSEREQAGDAIARYGVRRARRRGATSPIVLRCGARLAGSTLHLDLRPSDLDHPRQLLALESVLRRSRDRRSVTLDQLRTP